MKELKFTCPKCGKNELGSVEQVIKTYPITKISENGNLEYDTDRVIDGDGEPVAYSCLYCGYILRDEQGNTVDNCVKVSEWCKKNCSQE